jgi:hypothetical protein
MAVFDRKDSEAVDFLLGHSQLVLKATIFVAKFEAADKQDDGAQ